MPVNGVDTPDHYSDLSFASGGDKNQTVNLLTLKLNQNNGDTLHESL